MSGSLDEKQAKEFMRGLAAYLEQETGLPNALEHIDDRLVAIEARLAAIERQLANLGV